MSFTNSKSFYQAPPLFSLSLEIFFQDAQKLPQLNQIPIDRLSNRELG